MNAKEKHDSKEEYDYDIFVSYSPEDQAWVEDQLIPEMEEKQPRLKVCVHERDFQVTKNFIVHHMEKPGDKEFRLSGLCKKCLAE